MEPGQLALLALGVLAVAFLYSSVGHAGASGYIAVMSLFGLADTLIKPTALTLNILVASIASWQFWRAGHFSWRLFWPFALLSIPLAFLGGYLKLPAAVFKVFVGLVLLYASAHFLLRPPDETAASPPSRIVAMLIGGAMGLLAGLTGTGGGIFLTPLLLSLHWSSAKAAAAVSALFVLVNSVSGLLGNLQSTRQFPSYGVVLVIAAMVGGTIGSHLGSRRFDPKLIKRFLALVLLVAGLKLVFVP